MRKYSVSIVEDESLAAEYIQSIVETTEGFILGGRFESGEDALLAFRRQKPDLLITDIKLLGISGLDLIREIRKEDIHLSVIVISGYRLFEFAQEAIKLDIMDYLLKPINPQQLRALLFKAKESLVQQEIYQRRKVLSLFFEGEVNFTDIEQAFPFLYFRMFLVYASGDFNLIYEACASSVMTINDSFFRVIALKRDCVAVLEGSDAPCSSGGLFSRVNENIYKLRLPQEQTKTILSCLKWYLSKDLNILSSKMYSALKKSICFGMDQSLFFEKMESRPEIKGEGLSDLQKVLDPIFSMNWEVFGQQFKRLVSRWALNKYPLYIIQNQLLEVVSKLQGVFPRGVNTSVVFEQINETIQQFDDYEKFGESVFSFLEDLVESSLEQKNPIAEFELYQQIVQYIIKDLKKNFSLQDICSTFKISQPYVSRLFRTYCGKTFKQYVLDEKIRRAILLMQSNSSLLIKEIADSVGFEPLYFSTVFCREIGQAPSLYKASLTSSQNH